MSLDSEFVSRNCTRLDMILCQWLMRSLQVSNHFKEIKDTFGVRFEQYLEGEDDKGKTTNPKTRLANLQIYELFQD